MYERYKAFTDETPEEGSELQGLIKLLGHFFRFYGSCHDERCHLVQAILDHFNSSRGVAKVLAHVQVFSNLPTLRKNECVEAVDVENYAKFLAAVKQRGGVAEEAKQSSAIPDALNRSKSTSSTNIKVKLEEFLYNAKSGSAQSNRSNEDGSAAQSSTANDVPSEEREKGNDKHNNSGNQELIDVDMEHEKTTEAESNSRSHDDETAKASKAQPDTDQPMASNSMNGTNDEMDVEKRKERAGLLLASMVASQGPEAASSSKAGPSEPEDKETAEALREKKSAEALLGLFDAVPITQGNVMSDIISASSKKRKEVTMKENSLERLAKRLNSQKENMKLDDPNTAQTSAAMDSPDLLLNSSKEAQIIRTLFSPKEKAKKKDAVWRAYVSNSWEDDEFLFEPLSSPEFIDPAEYESDENSNDLKSQCNVYLGMKNSQSAKSHGETEERRAREPISFEMNASWARNLEAQRSGKPELKSSMSGISTSYPSLSGDMLHQLAKKMRPESPSSSRAEIGGLKASESNFSRSQRTAAEALCGDVSRDELRKKVANYFPVLQQKSGQDRGDGQLPFGASMSMSKSDTNRGGSPKGSGVGDRSSIPSLIDKVGDSSWQDKVPKVPSLTSSSLSSSIASARAAAVSSASYLLSKVVPPTQCPNSVNPAAAASGLHTQTAEGKGGDAASQAQEALSRQASRQLQDLLKETRTSSQEASRSDTKSASQYAGLVGTQGIPASQLASAYQQMQLQQAAASQSKNILQFTKAAFPVQSTSSLFGVPYLQQNATHSLFAAAAAASAAQTKRRNSMKHVEIANMIHTYSKTIQQLQNRQYLMQVPALNLGARTGLTLGAFPNPSFLTAQNLFAKIGHLSTAAASLQALQQVQAQSQQQQSQQQAQQQKLSQQSTSSQPQAQAPAQQQAQSSHQQTQKPQQTQQQRQASPQPQQQQQPSHQQKQQQQASGSQPSGSSARASPPAGSQQSSSQPPAHESASQQLPSQTATAGPKSVLNSVGGPQTLSQAQSFLNLRSNLTGLQQYGPALNIALAAGRGSLPLGVTRGVPGSLFTDPGFTLGGGQQLGQQRMGTSSSQTALGDSILSAMNGSSSREGVIDLTQEEAAQDSGSSAGQ
uniref:Uncharacterized protein n=1 Tax=Guillardia theta TaxID=55529 RepID=A0A7S4N3C7_GUITH